MERRFKRGDAHPTGEGGLFWYSHSYDYFELAANFLNCRPAWEFDNLSKSDKIIPGLVTKHEMDEALRLLTE